MNSSTHPATPLAERMRPKLLTDYIGQQDIVGPQGILFKALQSGNIHSMILWGPPGVGKTTLAQIIAEQIQLPFFQLSAIESGVKEVRQVIQQAKALGKVILFIDEIHRFNKSQQDSLLGAVEKGYITLIGATTENPSFEVIHALLSRCQVYVLKAFTAEELKALAKRALNEDEWLHSKNLIIEEWDALIQLSDGDGRKLLNLLELIAGHVHENPAKINNEFVKNIVQKNIAIYDKSGEQHYNLASAFIKSIRGSDPNAAVYYLARMIEGGEDPKFIARRLVILASEDIGNANPNALLLATSCFQAVNLIGYPESRIILSQTAIYLAGSAKSNSTYEAINKAMRVVRDTGNLPVPLSLRNAPTSLMKDLNYGKNYQYAHVYENNFVDVEFLPDQLAGHQFYNPGNNPSEEKTRQQLRNLWKEKYGY